MEKITLVLCASVVLILLASYNRKRNILFNDTCIQKDFSITGHRGAGGLASENTLSAIRKGIELKCTRVEIDVHQTSDSVIVIMHDETIDRMTNGKGRIKNMTYKELQQYTIKPFNKEDSSSEKIPTLEEVIKTINGKAVLLIELKQGNDYYSGIEERVITAIKKYKAESWCIIQSFKEKILERIHRNSPGIPLHRLQLTGIFSGGSVDDHISEVSVFSGLVTKSFIDKVHKSGKKVNVWTVNNKDQMEYFIHLGVDGIITDFPDLANEAVLKFKSN